MTRYLEYQQFEKKLEACLSSTAVKTKFAAHTARGRDIVVREGAMLGQVKPSPLSFYLQFYLASCFAVARICYGKEERGSHHKERAA